MNFYVYLITPVDPPKVLAQFNERWHADEFVTAMRPRLPDRSLLLTSGGPLLNYHYGTKK